MKKNPSMVLAAQTNITWGNERLSFYALWHALYLIWFGRLCDRAASHRLDKWPMAKGFILSMGKMADGEPFIQQN